MAGMSKTKRAIPQEQKDSEGRALRAAFEARQADEPGLTQESLIFEMGLKSQGQFGQWCDGKTPIPDPRLLWLGRRLRFDPLQVRPSLAEKYPGAVTEPIEPPGRAEAAALIGQLSSQAGRRDLIKSLGDELSLQDAAWAAEMFSARVRRLLEEDGA